ncbi:hypothetical protein FGB62_265g00 [Gracilaria domingensis]|nr:hypothetical protein FGB62_265g00 [Gracilaria domingensis]
MASRPPKHAALELALLETHLFRSQSLEMQSSLDEHAEHIMPNPHRRREVKLSSVHFPFLQTPCLHSVPTSQESHSSFFMGTVRGGSVRGGSVRGGSIRGGLVRGGSVRGGSVRGGFVRGGLVRGGSGRGGKHLLRDAAVSNTHFRSLQILEAQSALSEHLSHSRPKPHRRREAKLSSVHLPFLHTPCRHSAAAEQEAHSGFFGGGGGGKHFLFEPSVLNVHLPSVQSCVLHSMLELQASHSSANPHLRREAKVLSVRGSTFGEGSVQAPWKHSSSSSHEPHSGVLGEGEGDGKHVDAEASVGKTHLEFVHLFVTHSSSSAQAAHSGRKSHLVNDGTESSVHTPLLQIPCLHSFPLVHG